MSTRLPNRARAERNVQMLEEIRAGLSLTEASKKFGISVSAVSRMCAKNGLAVERRTVVVSR